MKKRNILLTVLASMMVVSLSGCKGDERYPRTFTVNFETGEGGEVIESQVVKEGYLISGVDEPDHEKEHIFKGWYLDESYTEYFDIENHRVFEDITLYAKWIFPTNAPQEISLANDAFTKSITWVQTGVFNQDTNISVKAYKGELSYDYTYDANYDKNLISGTKVVYDETVLYDVEGVLTIDKNYEKNYQVTYTVNSPSKDYYWFVISALDGSFVTQEIKDIRFKGEGTKDNPYLVYNETDLKYLTTNSFDENTYAELKSDITLMSNYSEKSGATYNGHFSGNKSNELIKTIDNYTVTLKNNSALFNVLGEKAIVENVTVAGSIYGNNPSMGVVANYNYGTIKKANSQAVSINSTGGKVNDYSTLSLGGVGGIAGTNYGLIEDCTVSSVRDNVIQGKIGVGGIAGINYGKITNMRVDAIIGAYNGNEISKTINNSFAGCVVGVNFGEVSYIDVYNGKVNTRRLDEGLEGEGATNIGGVVGYNAVDGLVSNCMFDGMRCVGDTNVGGIVGFNDGTIENCYTGRRLRKPSNTVLEERQFISPVIGSYNVGGIAGKCGTNSIIRNVFSTANVWAYRNQAYTVAERADNSIGVKFNQNPRTSTNYLGLKYGVPYSNELIGPAGSNTLVIDNSDMVGLSISYGLGFELNEEGILVANMQNVKTYLEILGTGFGFRDSAAHGIRLIWESSVLPLNELVIPEV